MLFCRSRPTVWYIMMIALVLPLLETNALSRKLPLGLLDKNRDGQPLVVDLMDRNTVEGRGFVKPVDEREYEILEPSYADVDVNGYLGREQWMDGRWVRPRDGLSDGRITKRKRAPHIDVSALMGNSEELDPGLVRTDKLPALRRVAYSPRGERAWNGDSEVELPGDVTSLLGGHSQTSLGSDRFPSAFDESRASTAFDYQLPIELGNRTPLAFDNWSPTILDNQSPISAVDSQPPIALDSRPPIAVDSQPPITFEDNGSPIALGDQFPTALDNQPPTELTDQKPISLDDQTSIQLGDRTPIVFKDRTPIVFEDRTPIAFGDRKPIAFGDRTPIAFGDRKPIGFHQRLQHRGWPVSRGRRRRYRGQRRRLDARDRGVRYAGHRRRHRLAGVASPPHSYLVGGEDARKTRVFYARSSPGRRNGKKEEKRDQSGTATTVAPDAEMDETTNRTSQHKNGSKDAGANMTLGGTSGKGSHQYQVMVNVTSANGTTRGNVTAEEEMKRKALKEIIAELEGFKPRPGAGPGVVAPDNTPCSILGSWISEAGGVRFDISVSTATSGVLNVSVAQTIPPPRHAPWLNGSEWNVDGEAPFLVDNGVFTLTALHRTQQRVATFVGQCVKCAGEELVAGVWSTGRAARDCRDTIVAYGDRPDVFRREVLHILRAQRQRELARAGNSTTTPAPASATTEASKKVKRWWNEEEEED